MREGAITTNLEALLAVTGALEAATGLLLLVVPSGLVELLLGAPLDAPVAVIVGRVTGAAMLAIGLACWLARKDVAGGAARGLAAALLIYNVAVVVVLVLGWLGDGLLGLAFWPVALAHAGLAAWCFACLSARTKRGGREGQLPTGRSVRDDV
jgi:hypothetical protein